MTVTSEIGTTSLRTLLEQGVRTRPEGVALSGGTERVSWSELRDRARRVADALVRDGVTPDDRVVVVAKNDLRFFDVLFGCALAGAVLVPLNWRLEVEELAAAVRDADAVTVFVDRHGVAAADAVATSVGRVVLFDGDDRWPSLAAWRGEARDPGVRREPEDVVLQLYTSGTTGRPKGAMFAGTNLQVLLDDVSRAWGFTDQDVSLVCMPLFHMGGLAWALCSLARGARAVIAGDFVPDGILDVVATEQVTMAFCVPTMLSALVAAPRARELTSSLRQMVYSGSPIGREGLARAMATLGCDFVQIYGLTEATGAFAQLSAAEHRDGGSAVLGSAGRPYPWVEVVVVEPGTLDPVGEGEVGEFVTRSAQNMVGYWRRPEETASTLAEGGWLRTGDLGRQDVEGRLHLVDRAKDMVISGGENIYPAEVEKVLATHPDVAECAVIGVPDERWGETVKALVVPVAGTSPDPGDVIAFTRGRMATFKCPTSVDVVESLPRTATGKVVKAVLREPYWKGHERRVH